MCQFLLHLSFAKVTYFSIFKTKKLGGNKPIWKVHNDKTLTLY